VLTRMRRDGRLLRTFRAGRARLNAYLDDYAFMAVGLLHLHAATGERRWLEEARALVETLNEHYWDEAGGGYFFTSHDHESLIARVKGAQDGAIPAGNAMAALALVRLAGLTAEPGLRDRAAQIIQAHRDEIEQYPAAFPTLLLALDELLEQSPPTAARPVVNVTAGAPAGPVRPGETFRLPVTVAVPAGWHLNSNAPGEATLIPTRLSVEPTPAFTVAGIHYPAATPLEAGFVARPLSVFVGTVTIEAELRAAPTARAGEHLVPLRLSYQPCTDRECLPPAEARAEARVRVGE
jgi:hypothetical protein